MRTTNKQTSVMFRLDGVPYFGELLGTTKNMCHVKVDMGRYPKEIREFVIPAKECKVKTLDMRKVYVVGYGSDCDGYNSGFISKAFSEGMAEQRAWESNEWSDGIHSVAVDEISARDYCDSYMKRFSNYDK